MVTLYHDRERCQAAIPTRCLVALELCPLDAEALASCFGYHVLADVQATVPLEPGTAARVGAALTVPSGGEKA